MIRRWIYAGILIFVLVFLGKGFMLQADTMFGFHDGTQAGRVSDFSVSIAEGYIPPRMAPNFSHQRGYPVFNHYAPLAYYVTAGLHFAGMGIPYALKVSFFVAVLTAGIGMWLFMKNHVTEEGALVGGLVYATSAYMGTEIFVRGNLAEVWFLAVFPLALWSIDRYVRLKTFNALALMIVCGACVLLAHNVLSLVGFAIILLYGITYRNALVIAGILTSISLAGSYLFPSLLELSQTHAQSIALQTAYTNHFLCVRQIWNSPIGYAGSIPGCVDGMSFQLGKVLIVLGTLGAGMWIVARVRDRFVRGESRLAQQLLILCIGFVSLYSASNYSMSIWEALPAIQVMQFPWRMLVFTMFAGAYFSGYALSVIPQITLARGIAGVCIAMSVYLAIPFFTPNPDAQWSTDVYKDMYLSQDYIQNKIAYQVPEYIPLSVEIDAWLKLRDTSEGLAQDKIMPLDGGEVIPLDIKPFSYTGATSSKNFYLDIHTAPFWEVKIDNAVRTPDRVDELGRPYFTTEQEKTIIDITYIQTPLQKLSNAISLVTGVLLVGLCLKKWKPAR